MPISGGFTCVSCRYVTRHVITIGACRYFATLRHPDLVRPLRTGTGQAPLISDSVLLGVYKRLTARMTCLHASEALVTITEKFATTFYEKHVKNKDGVLMTGDRVKQIMAIFMFVVRDLISPEACSSLPHHPRHVGPIFFE